MSIFIEISDENPRKKRAPCLRKLQEWTVFNIFSHDRAFSIRAERVVKVGRERGGAL